MYTYTYILYTDIKRESEREDEGLYCAECQGMAVAWV